MAASFQVLPEKWGGKMKFVKTILGRMRQFAVQLKVSSREETPCPNFRQHELHALKLASHLI
jgi:hypothetical protein